MTREEYKAMASVHLTRIADAIDAALEAGVVLNDFEIKAYYPPELGGAVVDPSTEPPPPPPMRAATPHIEPTAPERDSFATLSGNVCSECGSPELRNNGTCLLCTNCGSTTGCS